MGKYKKTKKTVIGVLCAGFLFTLASIVSEAVDKTDRAKNSPPAGSFETGGKKEKAINRQIVSPHNGVPDPYTYVPYEPAAVPVDPGMTGMVTLLEISGIHLINPRNKTISAVQLNEPHEYVVLDPDYPDQETWVAPLGTDSGGILDVAFTRDGKTALVSNFGFSTVYIVRLDTGAPVVEAGVNINMFAEDIAIDPSGLWALVTDGGMSSQVAVIHIPTRSRHTFHYDDDDDPSTPPENDDGDPSEIDEPGNWILPDGGDAQAVAIAKDGRTVLLVDYLGGQIHVALLDPASGDLSYRQSVTLTQYTAEPSDPDPWTYWPVNVSISPNGLTALVPTTFTSGDDEINEGGNLVVLFIDQPGHVLRMPDVTFPYNETTEIGTTGGQSVVFSRDGHKAYYVTSSNFKTPTARQKYHESSEPDQYSSLVVEELVITGAGQVSRGRALRVPTIRGAGQFFGIETAAISPDGNYLFMTNPTSFGGSPVIDVVNIKGMYLAKQIGTPVNYPDPDDDDPPEDPETDVIEFLTPTGIAFPEAPINLAISLDVGEGKAPVDEEFEFQVVLSNQSVGYACSIHIGNTLPEGLEIVSASPDIGSWDASTGVWTIDELGRWNQAVLTVTALSPELGDKLVAFFINSQAGYDPDGSNNRDEAVIQIVGKADLSISGESSSATPIVSTPFTVNLGASNTGPLAGVNVSVSQPLPGGWTVLGSSGDGSYNKTTGLWTIGQLPVGGTAGLQLTLQSSALGSTILTFPIRDSGTYDPDESNNETSLTVQVVKVAPPLNVSVQMLENDLVFTKETLNKISWQHNPVNTSINGYRIYYKIKGSSSAHAMLTTVDASATRYAHRNLQSGQEYSYKITAINAYGDESPDVMVEN